MPYTKRLITIKEAAAILALSPKTLYNRGAGTELLTMVRHGRVVSMIRQEVEAHVDNLIKKADRSRVGRQCPSNNLHLPRWLWASVGLENNSLLY